jgi:hypothetical protein
MKEVVVFNHTCIVLKTFLLHILCIGQFASGN